MKVLPNCDLYFTVDPVPPSPNASPHHEASPPSAPASPMDVTDPRDSHPYDAPSPEKADVVQDSMPLSDLPPHTTPEVATDKPVPDSERPPVTEIPLQDEENPDAQYFDVPPSELPRPIYYEPINVDIPRQEAGPSSAHLGDAIPSDPHAFESPGRDLQADEVPAGETLLSDPPTDTAHASPDRQGLRVNKAPMTESPSAAAGDFREGSDDDEPRTAVATPTQGDVGLDHFDPATLAGLLESLVLPADMFQPALSLGDLPRFLKTGIQDSVNIADAAPPNFTDTEEFERMGANLHHYQEENAELRRDLLEKAKLIRRQESDLAFYANRLANDRTASLEGDLARVRQESSETITRLSRDLRSTQGFLKNSRNERDRLAKDLTSSKKEIKDLTESRSVMRRRNEAMLHLLSVARTRYDQIATEAEKLAKLNSELTDKQRDHATLIEHCQLLERENESLSARLLVKSNVLTKIFAESVRVGPVPDNPDLVEPHNLQLREWQSNEALLRQALADAENDLPGKSLDEFTRLEMVFQTQADDLRLTDFHEGFWEGFHEGRTEVIANMYGVEGLNQEIDQFLEDMVNILSDGNSEPRENLLKAYRLARAAARTGPRTTFFDPARRS